MQPLVKSEYVSALINRDTSPLAGTSEHDWHALLYLPKERRYFTFLMGFLIFVLLLLVGLTDGLVHGLIFTLFPGA